MINKFKAGDKLKVISTGVIGWEGRDYVKMCGLKIGGIIIVENVSEKFESILPTGAGFWVHSNHFSYPNENLRYITIPCNCIGSCPKCNGTKLKEIICRDNNNESIGMYEN